MTGQGLPWPTSPDDPRWKIPVPPNPYELSKQKRLAVLVGEEEGGPPPPPETLLDIAKRRYKVFQMKKQEAFLKKLYEKKNGGD